MACEEAVDEAHFVDDEQTEDETDDTAGCGEKAVHAGKAIFGECEGHGDSGGDEHHARDGTEAKYEQVDHCPGGNANRGEDEERDGRGAGEAVHDSYDEWTQQLIKTEAAESAIHPAERGGGLGAGIFLRRFGYSMSVGEIAVRMGVVRGVTAAEVFSDPAQHAGKIQDTEQDKHEADGKLHSEAESRRNDDSEQNNE